MKATAYENITRQGIVDPSVVSPSNRPAIESRVREIKEHMQSLQSLMGSKSPPSTARRVSSEKDASFLRNQAIQSYIKSNDKLRRRNEYLRGKLKEEQLRSREYKRRYGNTLKQVKYNSETIAMLENQLEKFIELANNSQDQIRAMQKENELQRQYIATLEARKGHGPKSLRNGPVYNIRTRSPNGKSRDSGAGEENSSEEQSLEKTASGRVRLHKRHRSQSFDQLVFGKKIDKLKKQQSDENESRSLRKSDDPNRYKPLKSDNTPEKYKHARKGSRSPRNRRKRDGDVSLAKRFIAEQDKRALRTRSLGSPGAMRARRKAQEEEKSENDKDKRAHTAKHDTKKIQEIAKAALIQKAKELAEKSEETHEQRPEPIETVEPESDVQTTDTEEDHKDALSRRLTKYEESWRINYEDLYFISELGKGTSATVYKGTYKNQAVAIKVLRLPERRQYMADFKKELEVVTTIRAPNIVHFFGATLGEPHCCMVLELCKNGDLFHLLGNKSIDITWDRVLQWITDTVVGINTLHQWTPQIVHRDLKTLNLLADENFRVKVCDFGLSRFTNGEHTLTTLGRLRGTYAYTAPEVYLGKTFSTKSDVYSIGVILWEMVIRCMSGDHQRPFAEYKAMFSRPFQIIIQAATKKRRPTIPPKTPSPVFGMIQVCWAPLPEDRPSCEQLLSMLKTIREEYASHKQEWDNTCHDSPDVIPVLKPPPKLIKEIKAKGSKSKTNVVGKLFKRRGSKVPPKSKDKDYKDSSKDVGFRSSSETLGTS